MFDAQSFMDLPTDTPNEKRPPLPTENPDTSDGLYTAVIGEIKPDSGTIGKGERTGQPWVAMVIPLRIQVPSSLQASMKLQPELTLTDRVFLDLTPDGKGLDNAPGRNRGQKAYRDSLDLNKPGDIFSWKKIEGKVIKVKLEHEDYQGLPQERIKGILKA